MDFGPVVLLRVRKPRLLDQVREGTAFSALRPWNRRDPLPVAEAIHLLAPRPPVSGDRQATDQRRADASGCQAEGQRLQTLAAVLLLDRHVNGREAGDPSMIARIKD